ncbi:Very-long-chain 3-oxoacyl-CoA reductase [Oopsacas minuta]|uniref:Very-long-chain 3-oxoacyl-CoA reductase n=1 Tax=Oopsacas minuta TaxID=111878 RepID=A0AAV7JZT1_9METZ|nr:Very-long-chain 3-oxoacyl-CoA reductase [Oopsacas minuta]
MVFEWITYTHNTQPIFYQIVLIIGSFKCVVTLLNFLYWLLTSLYIFYLSSPPDLKKTGEWAVVTGCTDDHKKNSKKQSAYLIEKYQIKTIIIKIDFGTASKELNQSIELILTQLDIGVLVNNVGMVVEYPIFFCDKDNTLTDIETMLNVCCRSFIKITHMVLPSMLERNRGVIINIASGAGLQPIPLLSIYSACKALMKTASQALDIEYNSSDLIIQTVTPFLIATKLSRMKKPRISVPSSDQFVEQAMRTIGKYSSTTGYFSHEIIAGMRQIMPVFIDQWFFFNITILRLKYGQRIKEKLNRSN